MTSERRKVALVTGGTSGIGAATAGILAREGFHVLVVGRDEVRGKEVVDGLTTGAGRFLRADLQSMASIRQLAGSVRDPFEVLDLLVNNAGISPRERRMTVDGLERTFEVNTLAPYLLTSELLDPLTAGRGRVVNVVTEVPPRTRIEVADLKDPARYTMFSAYSRTKLALEMITIEQARRYEGKVTVVAVHPGIVFDTRLSLELPRWFVAVGPIAARLGRRRVSTSEEAGEQVAWAASAPVRPGAVYSEGQEMSLPAQTADAAVRTALWEELERITGAVRAP